MKRAMWLAVVAMAGTFGTPQAFAAEPHGVFGAWDLTLETRGGARPSWVKLFKEQGETVAEFVGTGGGKNRAKDVKVDGNKFEWTMGTSTYRATLANGKLTGHISRARSDRQTPFTGERVIRRTNVTGTWNAEIEIGNRTLERVLKLKQDGDTVSGTYGGSEFPDRKLKKGAVHHGRLTYTIDIVTGGGQEFTVNYDVKVSGDRFAGTATVEDADRESSITGTRQRKWGEPIKLFDGHDLSKWGFQKVGAENQWKVVDGVMVNASKGWNIVSKQKFTNYKLKIDVKVPEHGNSGIYINGRYEVQVADTYGRGVSKGGMGAIYGRAVPTANPSKPANEWQTFEITFVDYYATVVLNGTTIVDNVLIEGITGGALDSHEAKPGPIMLQGDHGHIEYRNIVVTPLVR